MNTTPATIAIPNYLAGTWTADPTHCEIGFSVRMLRVSKARGRFTGCDVTIVTGDYPLGSSVTATIDLASLDTRNEKRDNHLRSAEFLAVEKHPTMSYRSTGIRQRDDGWVVDGGLTLHGVTRQVPLTLTASRFGAESNGGQRARFSATAQISRGDFGIDRWTGGGALIGDKVSISLEIEAVRQK